jgi:hypothetical protein
MKSSTTECIQHYIESYYTGGYIGISDLADYCKKSEGEIYMSLISLQQMGDIEIIKRFFCPQEHIIDISDVPYCNDCDYRYSNLYITTVIYVHPLTHNQQTQSA